MTMRVRFAPSPTGFLHLGGARTALFNYLLAKKTGGTFILRIEDTDLERSTDASTRQIYESLQWLGLQWDEGPYIQSSHLPRHIECLRKLAASGHIYRCFCTKERLDAERQKAIDEKRNSIYDGTCRRLSEAEIQEKVRAGLPFTWRFRVPEGGCTVVPETLMSGDADCKFEHSQLGDFVLTRPGSEEKPGAPLYNFCCAIDDMDMGITHVIRGSDHVTNTPRQILILQALGATIPTYTHLPLIMKANKKMSKRDADADPRYPVSISARRDLGYLSEATVNFLALLGWSMEGDRELFTREELIAAFDVARLSKANANFDEDKYLFINGWYIRNLPREVIVERTRPFLEQAGYDLSKSDPKWIAEIIGLEIERCKLLSEFPVSLGYFFKAPTSFEEKAVKKVFGEPGCAPLLRDMADEIAALEPFDGSTLDAALRRLADARSLGFGKVAQPARLAITGRTASPGLFEVMTALGRDETVARLRWAAENGVPK